MVSELLDKISNIDIPSLLNVLFDGNYYDILFPFLLVFALLYTVLDRLKLFKNKKTNQTYKPVVFTISLIVTFFGVSFELSPGHSVGNLMMMVFPNISALTIGVLGLYIVGSILAKDFFSGLFDKTTSSYLYIAVGAIGLGSVVFYTGIVMGFWDHLDINNLNNWNVVLAVACLILGIVFMFIDMVPIGMLLLFVVGSFVWNDGQLDGSGSILEMFVDPVIFMFTIVALLVQWISGDDLKYEKKKLAQMQKDFKSNYGSEALNKVTSGNEPHFKPYENRIYDIVDPSLRNQIKKVEKLERKRNK